MVSAYLRTADLGVFLRMQNDLNLNIMDVMLRFRSFCIRKNTPRSAVRR